MTFRILGSKRNPLRELPTPVERIKTVLDKLPDGDLLPTPDLAQSLRVVKHYIHEHGTHPILRDYREKGGDVNGYPLLWGNKKTIKALREMKSNGKDNG